MARKTTRPARLHLNRSHKPKLPKKITVHASHVAHARVQRASERGPVK